MSMNKKQVALFIEDLIQELFNHGYNEDYSDAIEYNDTLELRSVYEDCVFTEDKLDDIVGRVNWDEEFDLNYDDGGLSSFARNVGKLLRKYNLIDESVRKTKPIIKEETNYLINCPICNTTQRWASKPDLDNCSSCGAIFEKEE